jgi:MoaA/NifB/PqqE/SkfB family radical SAM enzyme
MLPVDGNRYRCAWIENGLTVQSDGNVTCGLDDPGAQRSFGNVNRQAVAEIWANPEYDRLQRNLWSGHRCKDCGLAQRVDIYPDEPMPARSPRPTTLVAETTVRCNLRCPQPACIPNNDSSIRTRDSDFLGLDTFCNVVDDMAADLRHVYFFNYGDPFVHAQAEDMLSHLHQASPNARVYTSTNGIPLAKLERARKVVAAGALDSMVFTIGGITQKNYSRYHVGGQVELALRGMANVVQAKRELGLSRPAVHWRYLLFHWNDSEIEAEAALRLSEAYGVDEFCLYLTHVPQGAQSFRFSPGSPNFARYRKYIQNSLGYTRHSPSPDEDGFYAWEDVLGSARWTGWQAQKRLRVEGNRARIAVSTSRQKAKTEINHVFFVTPWGKLKVPLEPDVWRVVEITVPEDLSLDAVDVEIVTFDHWFPAEECGATDQRCLGVMLREDGADDATEPWRGFVAINPDEAARLREFRYVAPMPLVDW